VGDEHLLKKSGCYRFGEFLLDAEDRRLTRGGAAVDVNGRYFDALLLLVREAGRLVSKDRFMGEVWRGVPVTDEALTQCIRALRKALGDEASRPRMIETVPKHGYRFIGAVEAAEPAQVSQPDPVGAAGQFRRAVTLAAAGTVGGGMAGLIGGLIYGFAVPGSGGAGRISMLLVIMCLCILVALIGAAGVSIGLAAASFRQRPSALRLTAGGAAGGALVGAVAQLLGIDAFTLLIGQAPVGITGAPEGAMIGAAVGLGASLALGPAARGSIRIGALLAAVPGIVAGFIISLMGGRMMLGSLELLSRTFPDSRLSLGHVGATAELAPLSLAISAAMEGGLFGACLVGAILLARRQYGRP
jgi:DNA-binding winged helix-turn-helix (wHTH) protein